VVFFPKTLPHQEEYKGVFLSPGLSDLFSLAQITQSNPLPEGKREVVE
jgi:hypothetical protein